MWSYSTGIRISCFGYQAFSTQCPRVLITGGLGQLGLGLAKLLRSKIGVENVILSDVRVPSKEVVNTGPFTFVDILSPNNIQETVVNYRIDSIIHFSALLSAIGERNVPLAIQININGLHNIMEVGRKYNLKLFVPSTIGAFGPDSPRNPTPNLCIQRPKTIYGVSKVHAELLGEYYHSKFNVDFRSLRFPGVISYDSKPGGGTTDYAVEMFHDALTTKTHVCYLKPETRLPMMYLDDCLRSLVEVISVPSDSLTTRTYNVNAMSFSPEELYTEIKKHVPSLKIEYQIDERQKIADTWPMAFDDTEARRDWSWNHKYGLSELVEIMLSKLRVIYNKS